MRKNLNFIYEYQFVPVLMKNIYRLVNSRKVRNANTIAEKVARYFHTKGVHDGIFNHYYIVEDKEEPIYNVVQNIIMSVEEIKDLNLTQEEYDAGLHYDSAERNNYTAWGKEFVDITALIQNVTYDINKEIKEIECKNCQSKECSNCKDNDKYTCVEVHDMDGCSLDCPKELYVCCKNCEESCLFRCYKSNCDNLVAGKEK